MAKELEHLLAKHKVLVSFSIARKLNEEHIQSLTEKIKAISKNKMDFNKKLKEEIEKQTTNYIMSGNIPGLIVNNAIHQTNPPPDISKKTETPKKLIYNIDKEKLALLYTISSIFNKEVLHNKLTKNDICFIIYTILNFLEIKEEDFKKFHKDIDRQDNNNDDETYE
jgi:hypothetical protein